MPNTLFFVTKHFMFSIAEVRGVTVDGSKVLTTWAHACPSHETGACEAHRHFSFLHYGDDKYLKVCFETEQYSSVGTH